jgi:hypothetical protein
MYDAMSATITAEGYWGVMPHRCEPMIQDQRETRKAPDLIQSAEQAVD